jgi:UDP-N-acetylglucosamine 2-epimerase (non-hydrolysing)
MLDSLRWAKKLYSKKKHPKFLDKKFAIVSLHRVETILKKNRLKQVTQEIQKISKKIKLLFILHPPTKAALKDKALYDSLENEPNCLLLPRQDFFEFNNFLTKAEFIITDGGSNQEECFYLGIPCLLFRSETERLEGLGENAVISSFNPTIIENFVLNYKSYRRQPIDDVFSPSRFIVDQLKEYI